ncbi:MAG: FecR domain-containing protein [Fuerstiella sp.]|nr:FecR domain-containing protein [Fuerstiella sp.]
MSDDHRSLPVLIQEMLDGALDDDQRADLLKRVKLDDAARKLYLDQIATHTALQAVLADCLPQKVGMPKAVGAETRPTVVFRNKWPAVAAIASMAATITLLVCGVGYLWIRSQNPPIAQSIDTPHVAMVTQSVGAYSGDVAIRPGQKIMSGQLSLDRGLVRLDFVSGASIAIEGPAKIDVVNRMRVVLLRGVVTARIPESAIDFVVDTDTAHVVDLGTAFGVAVARDGTTDVVVFEGKVSVSKKGSTSNQPTLVREGHAVRASEQSPTIDSTDYAVAPFENAWPVNSGVLQTTGSIRFVSPGPDFHPGNYEDNEHIVVFPERSAFIPEEVIRVDMVDPGEYAKSAYDEKPELPPGRRLTSYLLQLDAYPEGKNPNRRRSVRGQITFANPIAGVITMNRLLKESEAIVGLPGVSYPSPRTIEPRPEGDERPGFDSLILAADRRTLFVELQENPGHLDQVRVLIEAEE